MGQPTSVASFCSLSSIQNGGEGWGEEGRFPRLQFRLAKTVPPLPGPLLPRREERGKRGASLILCGVAGINISSLLCTAMPQFNRRLGRFNAEGAEVRRDSQRVLLLCVSPRFLCVSALKSVSLWLRLRRAASRRFNGARFIWKTANPNRIASPSPVGA